MRYLTGLIALSAGLLLVGCAATPDKTIQFKGLSDCEPAKTLLGNPQNLGPASSTHTLQCALTAARESNDPLVLRSSLGSRLALHLAERSPDETNKEALANEGVTLAERALAQGGNKDGEVHYYLAANLGLAIHDHPLQAADNLSRLEQELNTAVGLRPSVDQGGPLRLLGMLYLKAPPWPTGIGDGDKALAYLKRATDDYPEHPLNHLFYGQALWEVDENLGLASKALSVGEDKLQRGPWGYNKAIWKKEFDEVDQEISASNH